MSPDITASLKAKDLGNAAFKAGDFLASIGHYTSAILADPNNPTFHLNRAAAYLRLGKYTDAERDSSSTLTIQKDNVKALFRRGQARMHLKNFEGSQNDLRRALELEPDNPSVREELQKVQAQALECPRRSRPAPPIPSPPKSRTRRVPIEIIDGPPIASSQDDLLTPVSSRPLDRLLPVTPVAIVSDAEAPSNKEPEQRSRDTSQGSKRTGSTKFGGGIFRSSGSHTIFEPAYPPAPGTKPQTDRPLRPAMNLAAFTRSWNTLTTDKERWTLLQKIPPGSLSRFFGSSLETDILSSVLSVLLTVLSSGESERNVVKEYMVWLPRVPRFFLIYTFLNHDGRNRVKEIWTLLDSAGVTSEKDEDAKKAWDI